MNDFLTMKFYPITAFVFVANSDTSAASGLIEIFAKNGFLALCLAGLAFHTAKERDKDRADRHAEAKADRQERSEERSLISESQKNLHDQIRELQKMIYDNKKQS